jgi:hypothetical protein
MTLGGRRMYHYEDHIGERFHRLTIKSFYKTQINGRMTGMYICTCQCNTEKEVNKKAYEVIKCLTISCGCLQGSHETRHDYDSEIGNTYGDLKILDYKRGENGYLLSCQCSCGSCPKWVSAYSVFHGQTKSCGCLTKMNERQEVVGKKFGKLTILGHRVNKRPSGQTYVQLLCECDCGVTKYIDKQEVKDGQVSCGCMVKELLSKRGNKNREAAIYTNLYNSKIKSVSKKKGMKYDIDLEEFIHMINQPCHYCREKSSNTHYDKKVVNNTQHLLSVKTNSLIEHTNNSISNLIYLWYGSP